MDKIFSPQDKKSLLKVLENSFQSEDKYTYMDEDAWGPSAYFAAEAAKKHNKEVRRLIKVIKNG